MLTGHCLCEAVKFEYQGPLGPISLCHCSRCRRAQGSAFSASAPIQKVHFRLLSGDEAIREFESTPGRFRAFCSNCGSPVYSRSDAIPGILRLRLGLVEGNVGKPAASHIYVGSKSDWFTITDDLPQFEKTERTDDPH